jgi:signal transduction histidine kinase
MRAWFERNASKLAWAVWAVSVALALGSFVFLVLGWSTPPPEGTFGFRGFAAIFALTFGAVGALIASRQPSNPIGWLALSIGLLSGLQELAFEYAIWALLQHRPPLAYGELGAWFPAWIWIPGTAPAMFILLLFPDGHLLSPRWRWAVWLGVIGTAIAAASFAIVPGPLENFKPIDNPLGIGSQQTGLFIGFTGETLYGLGFILAAVSVALRFRRSRGDERQQMKWLVAAGLFLALTLVSSFAGQIILNPTPGTQVPLWIALLVIAGFSSLPVAMGFAILKYRLYDLDLVIRKGVVFGILVVLLMAIFLVVATAVGGRVAGIKPGESVLPALALAFAIGVLTIPLWRLSRRIADRVVFGGRSTPYEVLAEFSERVSETYSSEDVLPRMAQVLGTALGAEEATVWLWIGDRYRMEASWPVGSFETELPRDAFEVRQQGELLGALAVRQPASDPMNPSKDRLARDLASQAGPVLRNVRLIEELRESRRRIVAAQDERAKKLERDIHDGAQQQLVALAVKQRLASSLVGKDDEKAREMLEELQGETNSALENLRDLARGIYPPVLADQGLAAALEAQARKSSIPTSVDSDGIGRYPQEVESAVYFSVLEALQNASKYSGASLVQIRLAAGDGSLEFSVADDGRGFDPDQTRRGTGLQGMADRLDAIGGELRIMSEPGEGTTVAGQVPMISGGT